MDSAITQLRTEANAVRQRDTGGGRDVLLEERNTAERERQAMATSIDTLGHEIVELDRLIEQMTSLRVRKVKDRADLLDAHSVKASNVAVLADRCIRSQQS